MRAGNEEHLIAIAPVVLKPRASVLHLNSLWLLLLLRLDVGLDIARCLELSLGVVGSEVECLDGRRMSLNELVPEP